MGDKERYLYRAGFSGMSNEEVIDVFNNEVGNTGWTSSRSDFLYVLHEELTARGLDFSAVGDETSLSFARQVSLTPEGKLEPVQEPTE